MKPLLLLILSALSLCSFQPGNKLLNTVKLKCVLSSDKTTYAMGEVPKFTVRIINEGDTDVCLIGSLDASDTKRRMPYCYFSIDKPKPDTVWFGRCGSANPIRTEDFKIVKKNEAFNPYEVIDGSGFFNDVAATQKETFRNAGTYRIQFHYSTNGGDIKKFMGSVEYLNKLPDSSQIESLFAKVPRIELESNTITIQVVE